MTSPDTVERRTMLDVLKEALVGAERVVIQTRNALGEMDAHYLYAPEVAAALSAMPAQGVSVRPLEWAGFDSGLYYIEVREGGIANLYCRANADEDGHVEPMKGGYLTLVSLDDLKAAAQADYERRILSALSPAPMPVAEIAELPETPVGDVGNYYGGLAIRCRNGKPEWSIEDWGGHDWRDCPLPVFEALRALTQEGGE